MVFLLSYTIRKNKFVFILFKNKIISAKIFNIYKNKRKNWNNVYIFFV